MSKIVLDDVISGYGLSKINENFQKIQDELNDKVLYRDNPDGETNTLEQDVDVNGFSLYNVEKLNGMFVDSLSESAQIIADNADLINDFAPYLDEIQDLAEDFNAELALRTPEVGNYTALDAYIGGATSVYVKGVSHIFDGGHGVFRRTTDTPSSANGIYRQDGLGRWWKRQIDTIGYINPLWWPGADPSGLGYSTSALQGAIDYAETLVEQVTTNYDIINASVIIPPGRFKHSGISIAQVRDGIHVVGFGQGVSVLEYDGSGVGVTIGTETGGPNLSHIWLRDLTIRGGSPAYTSDDAHIVTGSIGLKVSRLNRNCGIERVQIFGHDENLNLRDCWTFKVRDCHIHDAKTCQINWQTALNGEITGSRIDDCGGEVMVIIDAQGASNQIRDFRLVGNAFQESDGKAVRFIDVSSAYIESNHFENNNQGDSGSHAEIEFITGSDNRLDGTLTLVDNYYSPGAASWTGTEYAVHVTAAKQVVAIGEKTGSSAFNRYMRVGSTVENVDILGCVFTNLGSGDPVLRDATTTTLTERWTRVDSAGATVETVSRKTAGTYEAIDGRGLHGRVSTTTGSISTDPYRAFFNMAGNGQTLTLRTEEEIDGFSIVVRKYSTSGQLTVATDGASLISLNGLTNNNAVLNSARGAAIFTFDGGTGNWVCLPMDEAAGWALAA